jgi:hypothetical protein
VNLAVLMMLVRGACPVLALAALLGSCLPAPASAQGWHIDAQAGRLRFDAGPDDADFASFTLGIARDGARGGLRLAVAVPLAERDPLYGAAGGWHRWQTRAGPLTTGVDLSAQGFVYRDRSPRAAGLLPLPADEAERTGFGVAGEVFPFVSIGRGQWQAEARFGLAHYQSDFADVVRRRTLPVVDLRLAMVQLPALVFSTESRYYAARERSYPYAGVLAQFTHGRLRGWGSVGHWFVDTARAAPWAAGASVRVGSLITFSASARRHTLDPLYRAPPRTTWGVGASLMLSRPAQPSEPVPAAYVDGRATIIISAADLPAAPRIAGDFNGWQPEPMRRDGGNWLYERALKPGVYHYAFVDEAGRWFVPETVRGGRRADGMGGHVAVLIVERQ